MSYKTIMVHVDEGGNVQTRIELAAQLALDMQAHLIGSAMTGVSRFLYESVALDSTNPTVAPYLDMLRQRSDAALTTFDSVVNRLGVSSTERRRSDDEAAGSLSLQARYCDLAVLGQFDPDHKGLSMYADVPEYVIINSGCPTLVVPHAGTFAPLTDRVLIAWNESMEASRAVRQALPLLRRARIVELAVINATQKPDVYGEQPGAEIAQYLARHDVKVDVMQEPVTGDIGETLLSLASNLNSTMMVSGCYGHSRLREIILGGVTRTLLSSMTVPVFMAH